VHSGRARAQTNLIVDVTGRGTKSFTQAPVKPAEVTLRFFISDFLMALELARTLRHGPSTYVLFRSFDREDAIQLPYTALYEAVDQEIGLYASALRQLDGLSEFLCYYRVLESVAQANAKEWTTSHLPLLRSTDFGHIYIKHTRDLRGHPTNLFSIQRQRAVRRYAQLRSQFGNDTEVAKYLYHVNRCGIAHGRSGVLHSRFTTKYFDVWRDAIILKMLARVAIMEKMQEAIRAVTSNPTP
jgi:hypothetical protein